MTQEALKQIYQLLLTEPHAPTVCAQLERIAREALADHAMQEVQRLGQEIEQEPVAVYGYCPECGAKGVMRERRPNGNDKCANGHTYPSSTSTPPQRKPLTYCQECMRPNPIDGTDCAHGIKEVA